MIQFSNRICSVNIRRIVLVCTGVYVVVIMVVIVFGPILGAWSTPVPRARVLAQDRDRAEERIRGGKAIKVSLKTVDMPKTYSRTSAST